MIALVAAAAIVVGCADRLEPAQLPWPVASPSNVRVGPVIFTGLRAYAHALPALRRGGWYYAKTPTAVHAGAAVTIGIARRDRDWARLTYAHATAAALTLVPCAPSTPRFSSRGTVGTWTGFDGGFLVTRSGCIHFTVAVRGGPTRHARAAMGRAC